MALEDLQAAPAPRLAPGPVPRHVAIIMDGNGRWAKNRGLSRLQGHAEGAKAVRTITTTARENGIAALTLYAFSMQNWQRPDEEVDHLMTLLFDYLDMERATILDNGIRLKALGQLERLPGNVRDRLRRLEQDSASNKAMVLSLALSYGGREEIVAACQAIARRVAAGEVAPGAIDEAMLEAFMFTKDLPPLDLIVRTSGEMRLSNFLLWQAAYAELVVTDVLWPDFGPSTFFDCIETYRRRERRFGLTGAQVQGP
ncbi:MAG: di-trans,poly-cis-decaprenylcistransferase [Deltaproteobacteria bacterium]|nr:di-trans,poly-cis-decaprenylcistransferase [Deltaproteobacteria bacterium]